MFGVAKAHAAESSSAQWIFPPSALLVTPSASTSAIPLDKELYERARGIEFLYRLGASLQLPTTALFTAATWYHRFYMRFSMEDYHRQDVAAGCIFLATKTEECGRKLRDVAKVYYSKINGMSFPPDTVADEEILSCQEAILVAEEALLEALCFDFVVENPHEILVDLIARYGGDGKDIALPDSAWCIAHDSYRTVLCILFDVRIVAAACFILAQKFVDGDHSASLDARIASSAPSTSLPTPPTNKPTSPDASRVVVEQYQFNEAELSDLAEALTILIDFYSAQALIVSSTSTTPSSWSYLQAVGSIPPPATPESRLKLYNPSTYAAAAGVAVKNENPAKTNSGWKPVKGEATESRSKPRPRLDLE